MSNHNIAAVIFSQGRHRNLWVNIESYGGLFLKEANQEVRLGFFNASLLFRYVRTGREVDLFGNLCSVWLGSAKV
jgi:hypothetical protein